MNEKLAKQLLKDDAMQWSDMAWNHERKFIEKFSNYKYDEYQQYAAGRRFIEHLYLWLKQFSSIKERKIAYEFIKKNLIFISTSELDHIIKMSYPDIVNKFLLKKLSELNSSLNPDHEVKIMNGREFKTLTDQCLFLGLSDGARIDVFRRHSQLDHEQVYSTYLIADSKTNEFLEKLDERLEQKYDIKDNQKFKIVFLIDDFSASGRSFIRWDDTDKKLKGKLIKFFKPFEEKTYVSKLLDSNFTICCLLYIATSRAKNHIEEMGCKYFKDKGINFSVQVVYEIEDGKIDQTLHPEFYKLIESYYDSTIEKNPSFQTGNTDLPYLGYDGCGLTLVMSHNCPNNSIPLLWYHPDIYEYQGLFPRVERFPTINE